MTRTCAFCGSTDEKRLIQGNDPALRICYRCVETARDKMHSDQRTVIPMYELDDDFLA